MFFIHLLSKVYKSKEQIRIGRTYFASFKNRSGFRESLFVFSSKQLNTKEFQQFALSLTLYKIYPHRNQQFVF